MLTRKVTIPSTFASICWFSSLFAVLFFTVLYLHPRVPNNRTDILIINTFKTRVTSSTNKYVSNETTSTNIDRHSSKPLINSKITSHNVSDVQVLDSTIFEHDVNSTSDKLNVGDGPAIDDLPRTNEIVPNGQAASNGTIVEVVDEAPPLPLTNNDDTNEVEVEVEDGDENYDVIPSFDVFSNPPWNCTKEERIFWLKEKLEESKIIKSTIRTRNFDEKIQSFLNQKGNVNITTNDNDTTSCNVTFFFTWISPASLFGKREVLVLESVFKSHPNGCVMILSRTMDSKPGRSILKPLLDRGYRILPIAPDFQYLFNNTPAQGWLDRLQSGEVDPGTVPITQNLSNLLRMVVLYKYGGVYLDTDMIILKSLSRLKNAIGIQSVDDTTRIWRRLNNAVLIFDKGHPLVWKFMEEFANTFDGFTWGYNGPYLTTRVVSRVLQDTTFQFNIMSHMAFYPVDWIRIPRLFEKPYKNGTTWAKIKYREIKGESYGLHLWNKFTRKLKIEKQSEMGKLVSEHCIMCKDVYDS